MRRLPWVSLALVAASVAVYLTPGAADRLVYDRALVEAGQWWRLASAVLVHFSASHLAWDAAALLGAGWVAERAGRTRFALLCAATAVGSSLAVRLATAAVSMVTGPIARPGEAARPMRWISATAVRPPRNRHAPAQVRQQALPCHRGR